MRVDAGTGARNPAARGRSSKTATRTPPARTVVVIIFIDRTIFTLLQLSRRSEEWLFLCSVPTPCPRGRRVMYNETWEVGAV